LLGLVQRFQGPESSLYFYEDSNFGSATGTFSNRNYFAALLYVAIPLTWALALRALRDGLIHRYVIIGLAAVMLLILVLGLAVAGSRAGILLGMVALLGSSFLAWGQGKKIAANLGSRFAVPALIGALFILGQFGMMAILRLAETDAVTELRAQIYRTTIQAAWEYYPVGSGFGTFVPIYAMHETPPTMVDEYINHAHNDWLELWLEGGLPVALVVAAFLFWYAGNSIRLWRTGARDGANLLPRAATLAIALLLIHSLVDFPLRAPALASLLGIFVAVIASAPIGARVRHRIHKEPIMTSDPVPARTAAWRTGPFLAPRNSGPVS
jgi:O-antigen ligase